MSHRQMAKVQEYPRNAKGRMGLTDNDYYMYIAIVACVFRKAETAKGRIEKLFKK